MARAIQPACESLGFRTRRLRRTWCLVVESLTGVNVPGGRGLPGGDDQQRLLAGAYFHHAPSSEKATSRGSASDGELVGWVLLGAPLIFMPKLPTQRDVWVGYLALALSGGLPGRLAMRLAMIGTLNEATKLLGTARAWRFWGFSGVQGS